MDPFNSCNNRLKNRPARMADGRLFTDYLPPAMIYTEVQDRLQLKSSEDLRQYFIHNAQSLMQKQRENPFKY